MGTWYVIIQAITWIDFTVFDNVKTAASVSYITRKPEEDGSTRHIQICIAFKNDWYEWDTSGFPIDFTIDGIFRMFLFFH